MSQIKEFEEKMQQLGASDPRGCSYHPNQITASTDGAIDLVCKACENEEMAAETLKDLADEDFEKIRKDQDPIGAWYARRADERHEAWEAWNAARAEHPKDLNKIKRLLEAYEDAGYTGD